MRELKPSTSLSTGSPNWLPLHDLYWAGDTAFGTEAAASQLCPMSFWLQNWPWSASLPAWKMSNEPREGSVDRKFWKCGSFSYRNSHQANWNPINGHFFIHIRRLYSISLLWETARGKREKLGGSKIAFYTSTFLPFLVNRNWRHSPNSISSRKLASFFLFLEFLYMRVTFRVLSNFAIAVFLFYLEPPLKQMTFTRSFGNFHFCFMSVGQCNRNVIHYANSKISSCKIEFALENAIDNKSLFVSAKQVTIVHP